MRSWYYIWQIFTENCDVTMVRIFTKNCDVTMVMVLQMAENFFATHCNGL